MNPYLQYRREGGALFFLTLLFKVITEQEDFYLFIFYNFLCMDILFSPKFCKIYPEYDIITKGVYSKL